MLKSLQDTTRRKKRNFSNKNCFFGQNLGLEVPNRRKKETFLPNVSWDHFLGSKKRKKVFKTQTEGKKESFRTKTVSWDHFLVFKNPNCGTQPLSESLNQKENKKFLQETFLGTTFWCSKVQKRKKKRHFSNKNCFFGQNLNLEDPNRRKKEIFPRNVCWDHFLVFKSPKRCFFGGKKFPLCLEEYFHFHSNQFSTFTSKKFSKFHFFQKTNKFSTFTSKEFSKFHFFQKRIIVFIQLFYSFDNNCIYTIILSIIVFIRLFYFLVVYIIYI